MRNRVRKVQGSHDVIPAAVSRVQGHGGVGQGLRTLFLCRYLASEDLRREVNEGLNVVESWSAANEFIFYERGGELGRPGELASPNMSRSSSEPERANPHPPPMVGRFPSAPLAATTNQGVMEGHASTAIRAVG